MLTRVLGFQDMDAVGVGYNGNIGTKKALEDRFTEYTFAVFVSLSGRVIASGSRFHGRIDQVTVIRRMYSRYPRKTCEDRTLKAYILFLADATTHYA